MTKLIERGRVGMEAIFNVLGVRQTLIELLIFRNVCAIKDITMMEINVKVYSL